MKRKPKMVTEKRWMLTCWGKSDQVWPILSGRTRQHLLDLGTAWFRTSERQLMDSGMKPIRVTLTYKAP